VLLDERHKEGQNGIEQCLLAVIDHFGSLVFKVFTAESSSTFNIFHHPNTDYNKGTINASEMM
jgi:hypothetical protein